jgi:hypothetical protein
VVFVKMNQQTQSRSVWINEDGLNKIREKMAILQKPEDNNKKGKRSWTINYLADQAYVSESVVKRLLNKKIPIDRSYAISILKVLEFEPFQFIAEHDLKLKVSNQNSEKNMMIDWRLICQEMLKEQQEERRFRTRATEQGFEVKVFLPLGLTKRKQQQRRDSKEFDNKKDPYQLQEEVIQRIYKHDDFLRDVIEEKTTSQAKHLAIIGEPGAGKSTWLDSIATHIQENTENLAICISLANLQGKTLKQYLLEEWLPEAIPLIYPNADIDESHEKSLQKTLQQGGVWLLLDGVDEIKETTSSYILDDIQQQLTGYLSKVRVILTCRTNVWDVKVNNGMTGFDTYKTQEFSSSDIRLFIKQWFGFARQPKQGKILRTKLDESQYSNIENLIKNPLRLSLFCQVYGKDEKIEFPKTKAELYQNFLNYFYDWKPNQTNIDWSTQLELKDELHRSLGKLSIAGLDGSSHLRLPLSLIKQYMNDKLFKLAWDLGWLNLVDRCSISDEPVYAFFHSSFQEYFAALAIDDPNFFLKHIPEAPSRGHYRIFESQWCESYLLYLGRNDLTLIQKQKEELLNNLMNFQDNLGNLYGFQLFWIVVMGIPEFPIFSKSDIIIERLIDLILDDTENQLENSINEQFKKRYNLLGFSSREYAINILKDIAIKNSNVIQFLLAKLNFSKNNNIVDDVITLAYVIDLIDSSRMDLEENIRYIISNIEYAECIHASYFTEILKNNHKDKPELLSILIEEIKNCDNVFNCIEFFCILRETDFYNPELNNLLIELQKRCESELDDFANHFLELSIIASEPFESLGVFDEHQSIKHLSDFNRCLLRLYSHLLEKSNDDENYSRAIQLINDIQSASYKSNIVLSYIIYFKSLLIKLFCVFLLFLEGLKAENGEIEFLHWGIEFEPYTTTTVDLFLDFFAVVSQKISVIKYNLIKLFINNLSLEIKNKNFSFFSLTSRIQRNMYKMNLSKQDMVNIIVMIRNENIDVFSKTEEDSYSPITNVLSYCSKYLSYPEFYQAWYGQLEIAQTLNQQILDLSSQFQPTEKTYPLIINAQSLEDETDNSSIAQEICNQIYAIAFPDETNIPEINNFSKLKREIPKIKKQLNTQNLALIFHKGEPNESLNIFCKQLATDTHIHIRWITKQKMEYINGILPQENLVNILQNWINQLD